MAKDMEFCGFTSTNPKKESSQLSVEGMVSNSSRSLFSVAFLGSFDLPDYHIYII